MFSTQVKITPSEHKITYEDNLMSLGSCFAENIGKKLTDDYFNIDVNPFGVLFNPTSIKNTLEHLLANKIFDKSDVFKQGSLWNSFQHSTLFSDISEGDTLQKINERASAAAAYLKKTNILLITFGTAWVYVHTHSGRVVANCHKLPASDFVRKRLSVDEIVTDYIDLFQRLKVLLPDIQVIMTVSPIRHWKDGAHENNISKSTLLLAIEKLQAEFPFVSYFPAYEIQLDELRDYRFYGEDMCHPSSVAVDYIWKKFCDTYFSGPTHALTTRIEKLNAQMQHRPIHPETIEYKEFLSKLQEQKIKITAEFPFLKNRM